jgi:hypothetical protein
MPLLYWSSDMKIWIFGLSWLWLFLHFSLSLMQWCNTFSTEKNQSQEANLDQKFKFSYKEWKWRWNLWGLLGGLKSYPIGLILFSTVRLEFEICNCAEPPRKSYLLFLVGHPIINVYVCWRWSRIGKWIIFFS